jgi:hypothetical protein
MHVNHVGMGNKYVDINLSTHVVDIYVFITHTYMVNMHGTCALRLISTYLLPIPTWLTCVGRAY